MDTMALLAIIGLLVIVGGGIVFLKAASRCSASSNDDEEEAETPLAAYYSRRHGYRAAEIVDWRKGRVILHVLVHPAGVTVRRRPHLVKEGR